jgi:thiol-disulfide isomerase/thioredoxin
MKLWIGTLLLAVQFQQPDAETRVVNYLKANLKPGQPVAAAQLIGVVFKATEEQRIVTRIFNSLPRLPIVIAESQIRTGRIPSLQELSEQFDFKVAGAMDVMLRIMESDSRFPKFLTRIPSTGEITKIDLAAIRSDPKLLQTLDRSLTNREGQAEPAFATTSYSTLRLNSAQVRGQPHLVYFWFTNCVPCVPTMPLLVKAHEKYSPRGLQILALNADRVLGLPYTDLTRADYVRKQGIRFPVGLVTTVMQESFGGLTLFPSMFVVNRQGRIVKHLVGPQSAEDIDAAIQAAMR